MIHTIVEILVGLEVAGAMLALVGVGKAISFEISHFRRSK